MQGRYGAKLVDGDDYLLRLTRYIHLNPVKVHNMNLPSEGKVGYLAGYRWSSLCGYLGEPEEIVDYRWLSLMHRKTIRGRKEAYRRYIHAAIGKDDEQFLESLKASPYAVGDERFIEQTEQDLKDAIEDKAVYGDVLVPGSRKGIEIEAIRGLVVAEFKVNPDSLMGHGNVCKEAKAVFVELCCGYTGKSQREIATLLGYGSESSISRQRKRLRVRMAEDKELVKILGQLRRKATLSSVKV